MAYPYHPNNSFMNFQTSVVLPLQLYTHGVLESNIGLHNVLFDKNSSAWCKTMVCLLLRHCTYHSFSIRVQDTVSILCKSPINRMSRNLQAAYIRVSRSHRK